LRFESLEDRRLLTVAGPTVSSVVVAATAATPVITWNVADDAGIGSTSIAIDGVNLAVGGPYGSSTNANYAGLLGALSAGTHAYVITATDVGGVATTSDGTFTLAGPSGTGPAISSVVVAATAATPVITWNVTDGVGILSTTITVDGTNMTVSGPFGDSSNANYAGLLGAVTAGSHSYTITATDANGVATTCSSTFSVSGFNPIISSIAFDTSSDTPVMTWNVADDAGIQSVTLTVNNTQMAVNGPYGTSTNANYSAILTNLSSGSNSYIITVTGADGVSATYTGVSPTISSVVIDTSSAVPVITWNVNTHGAGAGISSTTITVDGTYLTISGPFSAGTSSTTSNANYAGLLGYLPAGNHTFVITAVDTTSTTYTSTFAVSGVSPAISSVVIAPTEATPVITWNVADSAGIQSWTVAIDGVYAPLYGPYGATTNANFAAGLGNLATGNHTYTIIVTGADGVSSTYSGTFAVSGISPLISGIVMAPSEATPVITWNVTDSVGIQSTTIAVDATTLPIEGPYGSSTNANYAGLLSALAAGDHTYLITATGANGVSTTSNGVFSVASAAAVAAALSTNTGTSVKSDWLVDANSLAQNSDDSGNARDAAFAVY
jgi:hypothetical protein